MPVLALGRHDRELEQEEALPDADVLDTSEDEEEAPLSRTWAHKREGRGDIDQGEEDADLDEEAAAIEQDRLQKQSLQWDDFQVAGIDLGGDQKKRKKGGKKSLQDAAASGAAMERVVKDLTKVTDSERLQLIKRDAPEFDKLVAEFNENLQQAQSVLLPLVQKVKAGELPTSKGSDFLEAKLHLLLNYCMCIVFYLLLKIEGKPVKGHPVIAKLVELRTYLQKLRPLESRVRSHIDRLLQMASVAEKRPGAVKKAAPAAANEDSDEDPLQLRPNLRNLAPALGGAGEADADDDGDDAPKKVYKAPKDPTRLGNTVETKEQRKAKKATALQQEIDEFENDTYRPYQMTREQRQQLEAAERRKERKGLAETAQEEKFDDDTSDDEMQTLIQQVRRRQEELRAAKEKEEDPKATARGKKRAAREDDDDDAGDDDGSARKRKRTEPAPEAKSRKAALRDDDSEIDSDIAGDDDELLGDFAARRRGGGGAAAEADLGSAEDDGGEDDDDEAGDALGFILPAEKGKGGKGRAEPVRRKATKEILRNRGLEPTRPKDRKTPHTKMRKKFETAEKRHRSQVRSVRQHKTFDYTGERNINTHLTRSTKFK